MEDHIVHESIADAARTRHMWQQMAAAQSANQKSNGHAKPIIPSAIRSVSIQPNDNHGGDITSRDQPIASWRSSQSSISQNRNSPINGSEYQQTRRSDTWNEENKIHHPSINGQSSTSDSALENEKRIFMAYVLSHPDIISSLGISIPWQARQRYQQYTPNGNVKIELSIMDENTVPVPNKTRVHARSGSLEPDITKHLDKENYTQSYGHGTNGRHQQQNSQSQHVPGRYIKHVQAPQVSNGNGQVGHGWQKRIIRRQSQSSNEVYETPHQPASKSNGVSRQWRNGQSTDQQATNGQKVGAFVDESGNIYKSMGESIIAKEIREYREREEELRRSRSQLALTVFDDMTDDWKSSISGGQSERAHSVDHLQASLESDHNSVSPVIRNRSGSLDHLGIMSQDTIRDQRPLSVIPTANGNANFEKTKNTYGNKFQSHNANPRGEVKQKVPTYLSKGKPMLESDTPDICSVNGRKKAGVSPMEARIEQEVEEMKRREEELRLQREAVSSIVSPSSIASPVYSSSGNSIASTDRISHNYVRNWKNHIKPIPIKENNIGKKSTYDTSTTRVSDTLVIQRTICNEDFERILNDDIRNHEELIDNRRRSSDYQSMSIDKIGIAANEPITVLVDDQLKDQVEDEHTPEAQNSSILKPDYDYPVSCGSHESSNFCTEHYNTKRDDTDNDHTTFSPRTQWTEEVEPKTNKKWTVEDIIVSI